MKRIIWLTICMLLSLVASGQTQHGHVKTKGRLSSNGTVIAGTRLSGATITVKGGNPVVSGNNGSFSLSLPGNSYYLQNVEKNGYVLTDPEVISKQYEYSKNPLVLVLEDKEQQKADLRAIERKISNNLYAQLQKRSDELEALKEQNKITEEKYRELIQKLNRDQEDNEKLIKEMADRYSKTDFDEVDEFNRRISQYILDGKLIEADSMLNTKGDINSRTVTLRQHQEANAQEEQEIKKKQKKLEKSKAMTQKELEDLAQDCYSKFEIFKMRHLNDSAAHYIELRASLDTTNVEWLYDVALFSEYMANYKNALAIYKRCQDVIILTEGENSSDLALLYNRIGAMYRKMADFEQALYYHTKAINLEKELHGQTHRAIVKNLINIGIIYSDLEKYDDATTYYQKALVNESCELGDSIRIFLGIGACYFERDMYQQARESYEKGLQLLQKTKDKDCLSYESFYYDGLSNIYKGTDEFEKAIEYNLKALDADRRFYGEAHPHVAAGYNSLGSLYNHLGKYNQALEYLEKAATTDSIIFGTWHPALATDYNNIGYAYGNLGQYEKALHFYQRALNINKNFYGLKHSSTATNFANIGQLYGRMKDYPKALEFTMNALELFKELYGDNHHKISTCYNNLGDLYIETGEFEKAEKALYKALEMDISLYGENHTNIATEYNTLGRLYNEMGDYVKSAFYVEKTIPILINAYGEQHPYIAISYYNIGVLHKKNGNYEKALEYTEKAYHMMLKFLPADHPQIQEFQNGLEEIKGKLNKK